MIETFFTWPLVLFYAPLLSLFVVYIFFAILENISCRTTNFKKDKQPDDIN